MSAKDNKTESKIEYPKSSSFSSKCTNESAKTQNEYFYQTYHPDQIVIPKEFRAQRRVGDLIKEKTSHWASNITIEDGDHKFEIHNVKFINGDLRSNGATSFSREWFGDDSSEFANHWVMYRSSGKLRPWFGILDNYYFDEQESEFAKIGKRLSSGEMHDLVAYFVSKKATVLFS